MFHENEITYVEIIKNYFFKYWSDQMYKLEYSCNLSIITLKKYVQQ